jgi:transglutaminase-like putative cysteine protease
VKNHVQSLGGLLLLSGLAAGTVWIALLSWRGFLQAPHTFLGPLAVVAVIVATTGALLRWLAVPPVATALVQSVLVGAVVCREIGGGFVPTARTREEFAAAMRGAVESAQQYAAPIAVDVASVAPLLICGGAVLLIVMDLLACGLRLVPISGLALLAVFSVPAGLATTGAAWLSFVGATAGFLTLLHLDTRDRFLRWGQALGPADGSALLDANPVSDAVRAGAGRIGLTATALALAVPLVVPVMDTGLLGLGGQGGDDQIRIRKPVTDMRRDLDRLPDAPMLDVVTDDPDPGYLRIAVLNRYTGVEWSSGDRDVSSDDRADGRLPAPYGVAPQVPRRSFDYDVRISDAFESTWLPTQYPATTVIAEGDWRFDPDSMDFLAADDETTEGLDYTMTALSLDYGTDGRWFDDPSTGAVDPEVLELPPGVPANVSYWAETVTEQGNTDYERATLLQDWFRNRFTYDLTSAPGGMGNDTLEGFLSPDGRVGYCEQFASAMAVMARILGIPARVAVGFLEPTQNDDGSWTYSSHDLHAWPELYFDQAGWVRFEPTPPRRAADTPSYSELPSRLRDSGSGDQAGTGPDSSAAPTEPSARGQQPLPPAPEGGPAEEAQGDDGWTRRTSVLVFGGTGLVLLVAAGVAPRLLRRARRAQRLGGDVEDVWLELQATAVDLGVPWPSGRSPRQVGAVLEEYLGDLPTVARRRADAETMRPAGTPRAALRRIVGAVERGRYARPAGPDQRPGSTGSGEFGADGGSVVDALTAGAGIRARRRAAWRPRSLFRRLSRSAAQPVAAERDPVAH